MRYTLENFNAFRDACHNASRDAGWWERSERYQLGQLGRYADPDRLTIPTKFCLVHSEISEMYEGYMSGAMDEHLPDRLNAPVEGGDILIRIGDTAGYLNIDMNAAIMLVLQADHIHISNDATVWLGNVGYSGPEAWFNTLHRFTSAAMEGFRKGNKPDKIIPALPALNTNLARIVILVDLIARKNDWDLPEYAEAKMAYNAVRLDHKVEVRAMDGGKQF